MQFFPHVVISMLLRCYYIKMLHFKRKPHSHAVFFMSVASVNYIGLKRTIRYDKKTLPNEDRFASYFDFELNLEYTSKVNFYLKYLTLDCEMF